MPIELTLTDRIAMVTGAGSGIGRAIAVRLAEAGAVVACLDRDRNGVDGAVAAIGQIGGTASGHQVDVTDRAALGAVTDEIVAQHGRVDVLVSSAGIIRDALLLDAAEDELDAVFAVNTKGVLFACQAVGTHMCRQGRGSIITIASAAVDFAVPRNGLYALSKVAAAQVSRTLATELGPSGVRVNTVAPGFVVTPMTERNFYTDGEFDRERRDRVLDGHRSANPLGSLGEADDIADAVLYLASDRSRFVTGQVLRVHGGVSMPI